MAASCNEEERQPKRAEMRAIGRISTPIRQVTLTRSTTSSSGQLRFSGQSICRTSHIVAHRYQLEHRSGSLRHELHQVINGSSIRT